jgi:hypothetical protein
MFLITEYRSEDVLAFFSKIFKAKVRTNEAGFPGINK